MIETLTENFERRIAKGEVPLVTWDPEGRLSIWSYWPRAQPHQSNAQDEEPLLFSDDDDERAAEIVTLLACCRGGYSP